MKKPTILKLLGIVILLPLLILLANLVILNPSEAFLVQAASTEDNNAEKLQFAGLQTGACDCSGDTLSCINFASRQEAQACYDYCQETVGSDVYGLDADGDNRACESRPNDPTFGQTEIVTQTGETISSPPPEDQTIPEPIQPGEEEVFVPINLIGNGDFEFGFYQVPALGFEARDSGNVPLGWNWYRNQAYGKYTIDDNQAFGIECPANIFGVPVPKEDDNSPFGPIPDFIPSPTLNALAFQMQSSDQQDARLGVYQTIDVVPGVDYRFAMSGTIQVQAGGRTEDLIEPDGEVIVQAPNHTFELAFDQTGGADWRAIPHEKWTILPIREQKLYFTPDEVEKKGEDALTEVETYETIVRARSNKMTIFLTAWRKWANWRTGIFTVDCVSLVPVDALAAPPQPVVAEAIASPAETPSDDAQPAAITEPAATEPQTPSEETPATIPSSGGILEDETNSVLIVVVSAIVILGLVGAGIWNMRR